MEKRWGQPVTSNCSRCRSQGVLLVRCSRPPRGPEAMHWDGHWRRRRGALSLHLQTAAAKHHPPNRLSAHP